MKSFVDGETTAARDEKGERHAEQCDRVLDAPIAQEKSAAPMNADHRHEHRDGEKEGPGARQQAQQDEHAAQQFRHGRHRHPQPRRAHEAEGRARGRKLRPARPAPHAENFLRAVCDEDEAERETHRQRVPRRGRRYQTLEHQKNPFPVSDKPHQQLDGEPHRHKRAHQRSPAAPPV